jgi:hypothetical protein
LPPETIAICFAAFSSSAGFAGFSQPIGVCVWSSTALSTRIVRTS